ncbi:MAG: EVE domain-containing protein [Candidatus Kaiserbacteria bacterium]|nr:EVE domain-containing protein [Candidatus Kaiserbacteria bacterium]
MKYWLMKTEGSEYSLEDLKRDKRTAWEGVRNFQARNFMQEMREGDLILFYHSSSEVNGVYGIAKVAAIAHSDKTQFDPQSDYFEKRATKEKPVWYCVDIEFAKKFAKPVTLAELKSDPNLEGMRVRERGSRLSVQPVSESHFKRVVALGR